jgi:hypothetical protein
VEFIEFLLIVVICACPVEAEIQLCGIFYMFVILKSMQFFVGWATSTIVVLVFDLLVGDAHPTAYVSYYGKLL